MTAPDGPRLGVIVNQGKRLGGSGLEALRNALADAGHADPPWYEVPKSKKAPAKVRRLVEQEGVERILVWGGDGTVRRCADTILRHGYGDVALAVLPAGTSNLLALDLGIPEDLPAAVDIAVHGEALPIDAGLVNDDDYFLARVGTGFDGLLIRDADDSGMKDRFGRFGYLWAGIRNRDVGSAEAQISIDGEVWFSGRTPCVIVGNVGELLSGMSAFPAASPTDGRLDVGVVEARTSWEWARLIGSAVARRIESSPFARTTTAEKTIIELDRTVPWQVDGGDRERTDRFEIRCLPAAISICQPHQTPEESTP